MNKKTRQGAISKKIEYLVKNEGKTVKQAAGEAYGIAREGRLGAQGEYLRKGKQR